MGTADRALATFLSAHDLPFRSFCSCDPLWAKLVRAIQKAGPLYKPAKYQKLARRDHRPLQRRAGGWPLPRQAGGRPPEAGDHLGRRGHCGQGGRHARERRAFSCRFRQRLYRFMTLSVRRRDATPS